MKTRKRHVFFWCLLAGTVGAQDARTKDEPLPFQSGRFVPTWASFSEQYEVPDWYKDGKFGIWVHASPQDAGMVGDWYARKLYEEGHRHANAHRKNYGHPSEAGYKDVCHAWKLENWDPEAMMALYKRAGAKFFVAMANHHCNFDMWDSSHQEWNSVNVGPKRDVVGEWKRAADANGLRFGVSVHASNTWGWFDTGRGADKEGPYKGIPYDIARATKASGKGTWWEGLDPHELYGPPHAPGAEGDPPTREFMVKFYRRVQELVDKYEIDYLYWDAHYDGVWRQFLRFEDEVRTDKGRSLAQTPHPNMGKTLIADFYNSNMRQNDGKLEAVTTVKSLPAEYGGALVRDYEKSQPEGIQPHIWEYGSQVQGWHWRKGIFKQTHTKTALLRLTDVVSKNGVLLLNFPMSPKGEHEPNAIKTLEEIGAWMDVNGEAIYGTRPWKFHRQGTFRFTRKADSVFAFVPDATPAQRITLKNFGSDRLDVVSCKVLGATDPLVWEQQAGALVVTLPHALPSRFITTVEIVLK